jgi:hypothetical protein
VVKERKEKPQKRLEKCAFFWVTRKSRLKTRLRGHFGSFRVCSAPYQPRNFAERTSKAMKEFSDWHELEQRVGAAVKWGGGQ